MLRKELESVLSKQESIQDRIEIITKKLSMIEARIFARILYEDLRNCNINVRLHDSKVLFIIGSHPYEYGIIIYKHAEKYILSPYFSKTQVTFLNINTCVTDITELINSINACKLEFVHFISNCYYQAIEDAEKAQHI